MISEILLTGIITISLLIFFFSLKLQIGFSLLIVGFCGIWYLKSYKAASLILVSSAYNTVSNFVLISVPLFILMGHLSLTAGLAQKAYSAGFKIVGGLPGGLGMASSLGCGLFAAATGSSAATAATLGKVAVPEMEKYGYNSGFACAAVAGGGSIGILIPPSIVLIINGMITDLSIGKLLIAGIIPGILTILANMLVNLISATLDPKLAPRGDKTDIKTKIKSLNGLWGFIFLIFMVLGGIYAGIATPTEAAGCGARGALLLSLAYKKLSLSKLQEALVKTLEITALIMVLVAASNFFGAVFARLGTPTLLTEFLLGLEMNKYLILAMIMVMIFLLGWPLEWVPIVMIIVPIILPLVEALGFNLTWFAILVAVNLQTAWLSPPVALSAYFLKGVVPEWDLKDIYYGMMQFMVLQVIGLVLIIIFPKIALWLPTLLYGQ